MTTSIQSIFGHNIGERVETYDGHQGVLTNIFSFTGHGVTAHIREDSGRVYYCPVNHIKPKKGECT